MAKSRMKLVSLDEIHDKYLGKRGTPERDLYELEFQMTMIGDTIRRVRKVRKLTQSQLGELVGVQKAQISKLENSTNSATIGTVYKIFTALKADIRFSVKLKGRAVAH